MPLAPGVSGGERARGRGSVRVSHAPCPEPFLVALLAQIADEIVGGALAEVADAGALSDPFGNLAGIAVVLPRETEEVQGDVAADSVRRGAYATVTPFGARCFMNPNMYPAIRRIWISSAPSVIR